MSPATLSQPWLREDPAHRRIPFEYAFEFSLNGTRTTLKQTVAVSIEAGFTATSIGYGFVADAETVEFGPPPPILFAHTGDGTTLDGISFGAILAGADTALGKLPGFSRSRPAGDAAARVGIQLNPDLADFALQGNALPDRVLSRLFRVAGTDTGDVLFLYALFDAGTGRAFQSDPILNIAGLGTSNGDRPFRQFTPPIEFAALTTIELEVTPVSNHVGRLFVSLQGFKVLGGEGTPTSAAAYAARPHGRRR